MTKVVVLAVFLLTAIAAADTIRPKAAREQASSPTAARETVHHPVASSGFAPVGEPVHDRVLFRGREYLSPSEIADAFPGGLTGRFFQIAHLAARPDGTLVLAVYGFPPGGEAVDAIQVWRRDGSLASTFEVRPGTFGGGIGFADDGKLIAAVSPDGLAVSLFTYDGRYAGRESPTSW
jgi:hypothetical protein